MRSDSKSRVWLVMCNDYPLAVARTLAGAQQEIREYVADNRLVVEWRSKDGTSVTAGREGHSTHYLRATAFQVKP